MRTYTSRRLAAMHWGYGVTEGKRCGDCAHYNRLTLYCQVAGTKGQCWNVGWRACGKWKARGSRCGDCALRVESGPLAGECHFDPDPRPEHQACEFFEGREMLK